MKKIIVLLQLLLASFAFGAEYFVATTGNDTNPGTRQAPFRTINFGVNFLKGGDTLTILPGEYREIVNGATLRSDPVKTTTIRAEIPGSVILRGDVEAPPFQRYGQTRFTYWTTYQGKLESVYERDTFTAYRESNSPDNLDFTRGTYCYDRKKGKLFVVTTDGQAPDRHYLTIPITAKTALTIGRYDPQRPVRNLVIEGLVITGYNFSGNLNKRYIPQICAINGRYLQNCTIRNCDLFLCGAGILLWRPKGCRIENVRAYGNGSYYSGEGGNIVCTGPTFDNTIQNCLAFGSIGAGIRYYSDKIVNCQIKHCIAGFNGYGDYWTKGYSKDSHITECTAIGSIYPASYNPQNPGEKNNVYNYNGYLKSPTSLQLYRNKIDRNKHFADPENWDFRYQGGKKPGLGLKDQLPVHFIAPHGNDANRGDAITCPWKTLSQVKPHSTVYLLPGVYPGNLTIAVPDVRLVARGNSGNAVIAGGTVGLTIQAPRVTVDRLVFRNQTKCGVEIQDSPCTVKRCIFTGMPTAIRENTPRQVTKPVITLGNNLFFGLPYEIKHGKIFVHSSIMPRRGIARHGAEANFLYNAYTKKPLPAETGARSLQVQMGANYTFKNCCDFNGRGLLGYPIGPFRKLEYRAPAPFIDMQVRNVSPTAANFEFFSSLNGGEHQLRFGPVGAMRRQKLLQSIKSPFYTYSITGLKPGKTYEYQFCSILPPQLYFANAEISPATQNKFQNWQYSPVGRFTTPVTVRPAREYHVAISGDDTNPGTKKQPFRTIEHAAKQLLPGDTITVHQGTYNESIWLRSTGIPGRPLTFRVAPGEKVCWAGGHQKLSFALRLVEKFNVVIDGFYLKDFGRRARGVIEFRGGGDFVVRRIFYDGRSNNYTPGLVYSRECGPITLEHSFITRGFHGLWLQGCEKFTVRHNLFHVNQLTAMYIEHFKVPMAVHHNIFFDNDLQKQIGPTIGTHYPEVLQAEYNCFYWRIPATERLMAGTLLGRNRKKLTMMQYRKLAGGAETNFVANPQLKVSPQLISFKSMAERNARYRALEKKERVVEHQRQKDGSYPPWCWRDVMPQNPRCIRGTDGRPVGPDPAVLREIGLL